MPVIFLLLGPMHTYDLSLVLRIRDAWLAAQGDDCEAAWEGELSDGDG